VLVFASACLVLSLFSARPVRSLAAASTPPPAPTYIPTPIGPPPPPPIATSTAVPSLTPTVAPSATSGGVTVTPQATPAGPTVTPTHAAGLVFTLDAARVSRVRDPGDLAGLASVRPGSTVWLMMYYTVRNLTARTTRTTTYEITGGGHIVYKVTYKQPAGLKEIGRLSRYTPYHVPRSLAYGHYFFHAWLALGAQRHQRIWKFAVGRREVPAAARP